MPEKFCYKCGSILTVDDLCAECECEPKHCQCLSDEDIDNDTLNIEDDSIL